MKFLYVGLLLFCSSAAPYRYDTFEVINTITNTSNSIADYFSITCMYFLSNKTTKDTKIMRSLTRLSSEQYGKTIAFCNTSNYINLLNRGDKDQCHTPLRIILQLDYTEFADEFNDFDDIYLKYPEKITSGVWLIFIKSLQDDFVLRFFENTYMPFDLEVIVAWINDTEVHFKEVYQVAPSYPIRQPYFGNWSLKTGPVFPKNPSRHFRRTDLEGLQLRVDYIDGNHPFIINRTQSGYLVDIWHILERRMNMSSLYRGIKIRRDRDATKNSWLRIMYGIWLGQTDVGLADFVSTSTRVNTFDFSYPLFDSNFQLFFKIFENEVLSHTLLLPFENEIWLAVFIWFLIHSSTIFCACRLSRRLAKSGEIVLNLRASFFVTFGGLCGQGAPKTPKSSSCRILFLLIFVVASVVIPFYSASLTRYLTAKPSNVAFKDLRDFYETGTHKMTVVYGSFEFHLFNISTSKGYERKIFEKYIKNQKLPKTYKEALELICYTEKTAFYTVTSTFLWEWKKSENKNLRDECVLKKMPQNAGMLVSGMIYPKSFRFKELIDHHLRMLHSTGIINRLETKYWGTYPVMKRKLWDSVSLQESTALFHILIGGIVLALVAGLVEFFVRKRSPRRTVARKKRIKRVVFV